MKIHITDLKKMFSFSPNVLTLFVKRDWQNIK